MKNIAADRELETELQEIYSQATYWLQDISFLETETNFFKTLLARYQPSESGLAQWREFESKIFGREARLDILKTKIPVFLKFLEPYIGDLKKEMQLDFLNRYNMHKNELEYNFAALSETKKDLFHYTEPIMHLAKPDLSRS